MSTASQKMASNTEPLLRRTHLRSIELDVHEHSAESWTLRQLAYRAWRQTFLGLPS